MSSWILRARIVFAALAYSGLFACTEATPDPIPAAGDSTESPDMSTPKSPMAITNIVVEANPESTISCFVNFETEKPSSAFIELGLGQHRSVRVRGTVDGPRHRILAIGMRPESLYSLDIHAESTDGASAGSARTEFQTGALPEPILVPTATRNAPSPALDGWVMFAPFNRDSVKPMPASVAMYDAEGFVVWYTVGSIPGMFMELVGTDKRQVFVASPFPYELNLDSSVSWLEAALIPKGTSFGRTGDVADLDIHHDAHALPNGNVALLRYDVRGDRFGDHLQEITRTAEVVWQWSSLDHIQVDGKGDVLHGNAFTLEKELGYAVYSATVVNAIYKIDIASGDIIWTAGINGDFKITSGDPVDWFRNQHSPVIMPNGNLMVFDNGLDVTNHRGELRGARIMEYRLDEGAGTAEVVWQYPPKGSATKFFADAMGGAFRLPSGNTFVGASLGTVVTGLVGSRIFELSPAGDTLWAFDVPPPYAIYRASVGLPGGVELMDTTVSE